METTKRKESLERKQWRDFKDGRGRAECEACLQGGFTALILLQISRHQNKVAGKTEALSFGRKYHKVCMFFSVEKLPAYFKGIACK